MIKVRIPATTANIGSGFDVFGMAFQFYNYVSIEKGTGLDIQIMGESNAFLADPDHNLVIKAAKEVFAKAEEPFTDLAFLFENNIPVTRGLGSSAAAIVGGVVAANAYLGCPFAKKDLFQMAVSLEGHPDNIAPALFGGFTVSLKNKGEYYTSKIIPAKELKAVAAIPSFPLSTKKTRKSLPKEVPFHDAVFNIGRAAALVNAIENGEWTMFSLALEDKLHQSYRFSLIPGAQSVVHAAKKAGALGAVLSGSGPTILAFTIEENCDKIGRAMQKAFAHYSVTSDYRILYTDLQGAFVKKESKM